MAQWTLPLALQLLHQQYPGAYVTGGARDPNSPLGRANPKSDHIGPNPHAFDVRPIKGVSFNDYVASLRAAGLPVTKQFDEATHPFPWTTGPNWHISFDPQGQGVSATKDTQVATSPIDLLRRAQMFNVDIPGASNAAPGPMPADNAQATNPNPLGFDIQKALAGLAPLTDDSPKQSRKGATWATILGAISDGLLAMGGQEPVYAPLAMKQRELDSENNLSRQKLNEQIMADRASLLAKLQEQPAMLQDFQAFQGLSPEQKRAFLSYKDAVSPNTIATPQGTQNVPRTSTKVVNGKTYFNIGGQWFEEGE